MKPAEFVHLVQTVPIEAYTGSSEVRKDDWLRTGERLLRKLAEELGLKKGDFTVRSDRGGIAGSGSIHLHGVWLYVALEQYSVTPPQFMWRFCKGRTDYQGLANQWEPWSTLLYLPAFARKLLKARSLAVTYHADIGGADGAGQTRPGVAAHAS